MITVGSNRSEKLKLLKIQHFTKCCMVFPYKASVVSRPCTFPAVEHLTALPLLCHSWSLWSVAVTPGGGTWDHRRCLGTAACLHTHRAMSTFVSLGGWARPPPIQTRPPPAPGDFAEREAEVAEARMGSRATSGGPRLLPSPTNLRGALTVAKL